MTKQRLILTFVLMCLSTLMFGQTDSGTTYDFRDGTIITAGQSDDGVLTLQGTYKHHSSNYGLNMKEGGIIAIKVDGSTTVRFMGSKYSSLSMHGESGTGTDLGTISTQVTNDLADTFEFSYLGSATTLTFTLVAPGSDLYLPYLEVIPNEVEITKTDVWDFAATQLDEVLYNNHLTVDVINSWYDSSIEVGTSGNVLPSSFSADILSWTGGGNDRLRTTNEALTRYDGNISGDGNYLGRIYVNSSGATDRTLILDLNEDDEVTLVTKTDSGGLLTFEGMTDGNTQKDEIEMTSDLVTVSFVAKKAGQYKIYDSAGKPSYYRIFRKGAEYTTLTGTVDITQAANIPENYLISFTNQAGKIWGANVTNGTYSINLPIDDTYEIGLVNANGYIITNGDSIELTSETTTHDITIVQVDLYTLTGSILGLDDAELSNLTLNFTPGGDQLYVPVTTIDTDAKTYTVRLEANVEYTISAEGVNDYEIKNNTITIGEADTSSDITFTKKAVYDVTITAPNLTEEQLSKLTLTFTNINEEDAVYNFNSISNIQLRDGVYAITFEGLDEYPVELALTSNVTVDGAATTKELDFVPVTNWSFDDKVISNGDPYYKGLQFTGSAANEIAKGHLNLGAGGTIAVPVNPGEKVIINYYYAADFTIESGEAIVTTSGSTSKIETAEYTYTGTEAGTVTITANSTSYITNISTQSVVEFVSEITVGTNKDYQTITGALNAVSKMVRPNDERVTIVIDPGNYEEMLVVSSPNVTLKNASASPSIATSNKGVDIDANAVRITSYYGHGYNYYSMGNDQKWNADVLKTNKENGYLSYENKGAGTTNGSYWNATVVVMANGFEAEYIIFENSFNQYISKKESEDILELVPSENKGERPTDVGNTAVQDRSFVERAAALAVTNNTDKVVLVRCKVIGRQDTFYGGTNTRVVAYEGEMLGAVDYIFGGMTAVFYKTDLVMNTSDVSSDVSYLTAAQQSGGRGYLMYECTVTTTEPGVETASTYRSKPGYFGRPWSANTSEVVFYNTTVETSNYPGSEGKSLIIPEGWRNSLGGESPYMYEYGTIELSGEDNSASRVAWSTLLTTPTLTDGTEITTFNFTKGNDGWDPIQELNNSLSISDIPTLTTVNVNAYKGQLFISNVKSETTVEIYNLVGQLSKTIKTNKDVSLDIASGIWIAKIKAADGAKIVKLIAH